MRKILILFCAIAFLSGCATHRDIEEGIKGLGTYFAYSLTEKIILTTLVCSAYYNEFNRFPANKEELEAYFDNEKIKKIFADTNKPASDKQKEARDEEESIKRIKSCISSIHSMSKLENGDLLIAISSQDLLPGELNKYTKPSPGQEMKIIIHRTPEGTFKATTPKGSALDVQSILK